MLRNSDVPIEKVIRRLASFGVEAGYLVPTPTGLHKSIMDAHGQLRGYLEARGIHNYERQGRGRDSKVAIPAWIVGTEGMKKSRATLYRPKAKKNKKGDPRIWFSRLKAHADVWNLLIVLAHDRALYVVNASTPGLLDTATDPASPLGGLLRAMAMADSVPAEELLRKLREIARMGFVKSLRAGPTGVGMTLETMLGIAANSSKAPDFKGIEIKASRTGYRAGNTRIALFTRAPDWTLSKIGSAVELVEKHGWVEGGRRQLYCSLKNVPNPQGLFMAVADGGVHAMHGSAESAKKVLTWPAQGLRDALAEKHQQTFWVKAARRIGPEGEEFHYHTVIHSRAPMVSNLEALIEIGKVEVDLNLHLVESARGGSRARDHGYPFKMDPREIGLLFPDRIIYDLTGEA